MILKKPMFQTVKWAIKIVSLFFVFTFFSVTYGQLNQKNKNQKIKDSVAKSKISTTKNEKTVVTDSIKSSSLFEGQNQIEVDSLFISTGKFKTLKKSAHASYYADKFHNKRTASGKKYNKNKYSAAHKKLPFGTIVKVTNEANGKSVLVEVTDRGPFVKSRDIDLSKRAFKDITHSSSTGNLKVTLEVLQK